MGNKAVQAGNLALLVLALAYLNGSRELTLWRGETPGGGFMPLLLGLALALIALALLVIDARGLSPILPEFQLRVPVGIFASIVTGMFLLPTFGFAITCGLLALACFRIYEPHSWRKDLLGSVGVGTAMALVFMVIMRLDLPRGFLGI